MSLQTSAIETRDHLAHRVSITSRPYDEELLAIPNRIARSVELPLRHLNITLALATKKSDADVGFQGDLEIRVEKLALRTEGKCEDSVTRLLEEALLAAEGANDQYSNVYADALRLAIATRRLVGRTVERNRTGVQPDAVSGARRKANSLQKWRLKRVIEYIDETLERRITLSELAAVAGLSRMHFAAQFRASMGLTPHQYLMKQRIERSKDLMERTNESLAEIALAVGFQNQAHFTTVFKRFVGNTPHQWRCPRIAQPLTKHMAMARLS